MPAGRIKDHWGEQRRFEQRSLIAGVLMVVLTLTLLGRLYLLQVVRNDYYADLSQGNRVRTEPIPASRGLILDRNGAVLADNEPAYQLELTREQVPDLNDTLKRLTELQLIEPDDLDETKHMIMSRRSFDTVPVRLRLTDEEVGRFAVHRFEFPGVDLATRQTRHYPYKKLGVHALGYVGAISESDLEHIDRALQDIGHPRPAQRGHEHADCAGVPSCESHRSRARRVPTLGHHPPNPGGSQLIDIGLVIENTRHRRLADAGQPRDVGHGDGHAIPVLGTGYGTGSGNRRAVSSTCQRCVLSA